MKVFFKANRILPNDSIIDLVDKASLEDHEYHWASCNSYFSEKETARKQKSDYIVYIFSDFLMRDVYFNEVAMEAVLDIESFTSKVIIINELKTEIKTPNKILSNLHNKTSDHGGFWFDNIDAAANFIYNKKITEQKAKQEEEKEEPLNALDEYQDKAIKFDQEIFFDSPYYFIGLGGEVGEVFEKYKRILRYRDSEKLDKDEEKEQEMMRDVAEELGDVLWYVALIAQRCKTSLSKVAEMNIEKLTKRQQDGTLLATEKREEGE